MSAPANGETVELLLTLIRNACVNEGTEESGQEVRNSDVLQTYLEGAGIDMQSLRRTGPADAAGQDRGNRPGRAESAAQRAHRCRSGEPRRLDP